MALPYSAPCGFHPTRGREHVILLSWNTNKEANKDQLTMPWKMTLWRWHNAISRILLTNHMLDSNKGVGHCFVFFFQNKIKNQKTKGGTRSKDEEIVSPMKSMTGILVTAQGRGCLLQSDVWRVKPDALGSRKDFGRTPTVTLPLGDGMTEDLTLFFLFLF